MAYRIMTDATADQRSGQFASASQINPEVYRAHYRRPPLGLVFWPSSSGAIIIDV